MKTNGELIGLEGISKKSIPAVFIKKPWDIRKILRSGFGATAAGYAGAINVWRKDSGLIGCSLHVHQRVEESQEYKTLIDAERWTAKWLKKINETVI